MNTSTQQLNGTLRYTNCRACNRPLQPVLDLGQQHLSEFRLDSSAPPEYPLRLMFCHGCLLGQLDTTVPPRELYHGSYSFKSGVSDAIRADLADVVTWTLARARAAVGRPSWLDIACNDGTLLSNVPPSWLRYGIDPLPQFARESMYHGMVTVDLFHPRYYHDKQFDVITSISMFYDLDNPVEFAQQVASILHPGGVWVIQQNYLPAMLQNRSVDNISHEHITYFTLNALRHVLDQAGLEICEVQTNPINGGCIRTLVTHRGVREIDHRTIDRMLNAEHQTLGRHQAWDRFRDDAETAAENLHRFVCEASQTHQVWVYGASTRGGTLWQYAGLTAEDLPYVVDRNPDKVGRWMSSIGAPIISEEHMRNDPPDYLLVGPWWFRDQFIQREADYLEKGGKLVFPLPELEIVGAEALR
jgi:NDP-4-keto-2,6-dideoxyhexose 3-C-methyltransferase